MAKPGFRQVDNETFKALMASNLSKGAIYSVLAIVHETIGFHREKAKIPMSKFLRHTKLSRSAIKRGIKEAQTRGIIDKERDSTRASVYALNDYREWQTRVKNEPSKLGSRTNPNWDQKRTKTRSNATNRKSNTKETYKETFKEKGTPPPDELSLERSSSPHPSKKDESTPAGSCESLQPYPSEDDDIDPLDLPFPDPAELAEFEAEAQHLANRFSEQQLRQQYDQFVKYEDPEAGLWRRALEIKRAGERICQ